MKYKKGHFSKYFKVSKTSRARYHTIYHPKRVFTEIWAPSKLRPTYMGVLRGKKSVAFLRAYEEGWRYGWRVGNDAAVYAAYKALKP